MGPDIDSLFSKANYFITQLRDYANALNCYDEILKISPDNPGAFCLRANALYALGKYDEARKSIDRYVQIDRDSSKAWAIRAAFLLDLGQYSDAVSSSDNAMKIVQSGKKNEPDTMVTALYNKGIALAYLSKFKEAIRCFDSAIHINPKDFGVWREMGRTYSQLAEYDEALDCFDKAIEINPSLTEVYYLKGEALSFSGRMEEALTCYDQTILQLDDIIRQTGNPQVKNQKLFILYTKGATLQELKLHEEAIECFDNALEIAPKDSMLWLSKGISFHNLVQFDQAIECFDNAVELVAQESNNGLKNRVWSYLSKETVIMFALEGKGNILISEGRFNESAVSYDNLNKSLGHLKQGDLEIVTDRLQKNSPAYNDPSIIDEALRGQSVD